MFEALVETACFVAESEAIYALVLPGDYIGNTMNLEEVNIVSTNDDWTGVGHGGSGTIHAEALSQRDIYSVDIIVKFPGFLKYAIAKVLSREPKAIVYTSVYCEQE